MMIYVSFKYWFHCCGMLIIISSHSICTNIGKITTQSFQFKFQNIYFNHVPQPQNFPLCMKSQFIRASDTDSSFLSSFFLVLKSSLSSYITRRKPLEKFNKTNFPISPIFLWKGMKMTKRYTKPTQQIVDVFTSFHRV